MAEKKVVVFTCDRCGFEHRRLRGHKLPVTWDTLKGKDLCPTCVEALNRFLEPVEPPVVIHMFGDETNAH